MIQTSAAAELDLRGVLCPLNFVHIKIKLEEMNSGDVLQVLLDDGEPMRNVPKSLKQDGHRILRVEPEDGHYRLLIQVAE